MLETSARLLGLLALLQQRREWSGAELAERLEVDVRTVRRDVDKLRALGYSVAASSGPGGGYQLGAGTQLPPLLLDDDEAVAVVAALGVASSSLQDLEETSLGVLVKLDQLLPQRLRRRASALHEATVSLGGNGVTRVDPQLLTSLAAACRDRELVSVGYRGRGAEPSQRTLEPVKLAHTGRRWYLVAWDRDREDWRTFRLDRFRGRLRVVGSFAYRTPPEDIAAYISLAISHEPYTQKACLRLRGRREHLLERIPPWVGNLEQEDDEFCLLRTGAENPEALIGLLALTGADFELVDAGDLRADLSAVVERLRCSLAGNGRGSVR